DAEITFLEWIILRQIAIPDSLTVVECHTRQFALRPECVYMIADDRRGRPRPVVGGEVVVGIPGRGGGLPNLFPVGVVPALHHLIVADAMVQQHLPPNHHRPAPPDPDADAPKLFRPILRPLAQEFGLRRMSIPRRPQMLRPIRGEE